MLKIIAIGFCGFLLAKHTSLALWEVMLLGASLTYIFNCTHHNMDNY